MTLLTDDELATREAERLVYEEPLVIQPDKSAVNLAKAYLRAVAHIAEQAKALEECDDLHERLHRIQQWCAAYPEDVFLPVSDADVKRAGELVRAAGISFDGLHGQWARHIVSGIAALAKGDL